MIFRDEFTIYAEDVPSVEYGENFPGKRALDSHLSVSAWNAVWSFEYPSEPYYGAPDFPCAAKRGLIVDVVATLVSHDYCLAMYPTTFFLPEQCVRDCTVPGRDASTDVKRWLKNEEIIAIFSKFPQEDIRAYCKQTGAWSDYGTADLDTIRERCLWLWCCECREQRDAGEIA